MEDTDCVIIHEIFDDMTPPERGERELDKAMSGKHSTIVIEPHELGMASFHVTVSKIRQNISFNNKYFIRAKIFGIMPSN